MISAKIDTKDFSRMITNAVQYTQGFVNELENSEYILNQKVAHTSIEGFYDFLDGLARSHPGMLHHVYEWGSVGNPSERLVELTMGMAGANAEVSAHFLQSTVPSEDGGETFYDKAEIMEAGIPVTINEKNAKALAFTIDGEEYFRAGPIVIANPGGQETRGAFVQAFNEFYGVYFTEVYLSSIKFYKHFSNPREYQNNFRSAVKSGGAYSKGKAVALSWIIKSPGDKV
jgi:hypothetical protein